MAAQANFKAVGLAKKTYQSEMSNLTSLGALKAKELQDRHEKAMKVAVSLFGSLKEGDEKMTVIYLENMKNDIEQEMRSLVQANELKLELEKIKQQLNALKKDVENAKKPKKIETNTTDEKSKSDKGFCPIM